MTRGLALVLVAVAVLAACTAPIPAGYEFPRHRGFGDGLSGGGPAALLDGTLEIRDGCLYVRSEGGGLNFVVWPAGYSLRAEGGSVVVVDGITPRYRPGDRVIEGGGWYDATFAQSRLVAGTLPARCPTDEYVLSTGHVDQPSP